MLGPKFGGQWFDVGGSEPAEAVGEALEADRGGIASIYLDSYEKPRSKKGLLLLVLDSARSNWMKTEKTGVP